MISDKNLVDNNISDFLNSTKIILTVFLFGHLSLFFIFSLDDMFLLGAFEAISCFFYTSIYNRLKDCPWYLSSSSKTCEIDEVRNKLVKTTIAVSIELTVHMGVAMLFCGLEYNFQHYMYFILIVIMFEYYLEGNKKHFISLLSIVIGTYLILRIYLSYAGCIYNSHDGYSLKLLNILNPITSLCVITYFIIIISGTMLSFERSLLYSATHDVLTELPNRKLLNKLSYKDNCSYVVMLDIDFFKKINDTYGHDIGDIVLKSLSRIIKKYCATNKDLYAMRWGGEEFVLVYNNSSSKLEDLLNMLEEFRNDVIKDSIYIRTKGTITYTLTIGVSSYEDGNDLEELLKVADERLYIGKKTGRDKIVYK